MGKKKKPTKLTVDQNQIFPVKYSRRERILKKKNHTRILHSVKIFFSKNEGKIDIFNVQKLKELLTHKCTL